MHRMLSMDTEMSFLSYRGRILVAPIWKENGPQGEPRKQPEGSTFSPSRAVIHTLDYGGGSICANRIAYSSCNDVVRLARHALTIAVIIFRTQPGSSRTMVRVLAPFC